MEREVTVQNSTFIVENFASEDAVETLDDLLRRVITKNADQELKNRLPSDASGDGIPNTETT
jgi:hypothetical protein